MAVTDRDTAVIALFEPAVSSSGSVSGDHSSREELDHAADRSCQYHPRGEPRGRTGEPAAGRDVSRMATSAHFAALVPLGADREQGKSSGVGEGSGSFASSLRLSYRRSGLRRPGGERCPGTPFGRGRRPSDHSGTRPVPATGSGERARCWRRGWRRPPRLPLLQVRSVSDAFFCSFGFSASYPADRHAFQLPGTLRTWVNPCRCKRLAARLAR